MSKAKMTLIGMYDYMTDLNSDIFSRLTLPDGIDKGLFEDSLLLRAGEFEVLYANPFFMQEAIGVWGRKWYRTFQKWIEALNIEYAPLENYDRMEDWTENEKTDDDLDSQIDKTDSGSLSSERDTTGESTVSSDSENKVSAYNSSVYEPDSTNISSGETTNSDTETISQETENTGRETEKSFRDINRNNRKTGRAHGNIGVTTSQQMLQAELEISEWNIYDNMSKLFIRELLIPVYS